MANKYLLTYLLTYRLHQQRCQVNFLSYVFVTSRNLLFGVFLPKKIITILRKIAVSVRQVSVRGVLLSVSILECFGKIFQKCLWTSWIFKNPLLHMHFFAIDFNFSRRIFFHLFTYHHLFTEAFLGHIWPIYCLFDSHIY